jgi:hypothetical protein
VVDLRAITATLTAVGVIDKITAKGNLQWGFNGWTFYLFIYLFIYPDSIFLTE